MASKSKAQSVLEYARNNSYSGPPISGETYADWPVSVLEKMAGSNLVDHIELRREMLSSVPLGMPITGSVNFGDLITPPMPYSLEERMRVRMGWYHEPAPWAPGFEHLVVHEAGDTVHIWIITKDGKSVVLEDEAGMYPSDTLVTKLRLLVKE